MALANRTEIYDIDINKLYDVILDYAKYPEFVDGVDSIEVLESSESGALVKYSINLIKQFTYTLKLTHEKPNKVSWVLESGDIFKSNVGGWDLKDLGDGKTEVTYSLEIGLKIFAPKMIVNKLTSSNLPSMMKAFIDRAKSL
jgi:coenzyme Q-binding protein COQ10